MTEKCVKCTKMYSRKQTRETFEINIHRLECHARVSPSSHTIFKSKGWQNVHHFPTKLLISIHLNGNMINTNAKVLYMSFLYNYKLHSSYSIPLQNQHANNGDPILSLASASHVFLYSLLHVND